MSRIAIFFLLVIAPLLAMLLALLGVETVFTNPLGGFLLLVGLAYLIGLVIVYWIRKERFWESSMNGATIRQEHGDRSFWLITAGMLAVFYLSPVEYLYITAFLPRTPFMAAGGLGLVILGVVLFIWARKTLRDNYSGHISVKAGQTLVQSGPYRFIRHPAYTGYLLMALGISLGYASLAGLVAVLLLLLPGMVYRMNVEEKLLAQHFGDAYSQYMCTTKRLIPGIW
jgi:protein-S-isoprenylcysteine O-methyltransferase Ste14